MSSAKKYKPVDYYYIADPSFWPIIGSIGIFTMLFGLVQVLHSGVMGPYLMMAGAGVILATMFGWFGHVIKESVAGLHSHQLDKTYRWGMLWFIVSEIFLFGIFFGALFYTRVFSLNEMAGVASTLARDLLLYRGDLTHQYLWPAFDYTWPLLKNPNPTQFVGPKDIIYVWHIPALNTILLLSSAVTLTWSHWGLKKGNRSQMLIGLMLTILLGATFEGFQVHEYIEAYTEYGLTLASGIYGSTFFTLTGLHAMHVSVGVIMLSVILWRCLKGHFLPEHHFAFEAVSWYWHFVDVVWLILFVFVYWL